MRTLTVACLRIAMSRFLASVSWPAGRHARRPARDPARLRHEPARKHEGETTRRGDAGMVPTGCPIADVSVVGCRRRADLDRRADHDGRAGAAGRLRVLGAAPRALRPSHAGVECCARCRDRAGEAAAISLLGGGAFAAAGWGSGLIAGHERCAHARHRPRSVRAEQVDGPGPPGSLLGRTPLRCERPACSPASRAFRP